MKFTIPSNVARGLLNLAADKDIRYYLNGVMCEVSPRRVIMAVTNGHMLGAWRHDATDGDVNDVDGTVQVIIPREALQQVLKAKKCTPLLVVQSPAIPSNEMCLVDAFNGVSVNFTPIDAKFPNFRHVLIRDAGTGVGPAQFNPAYVMAFNKAARDILDLGTKRDPTVTIGHRGPDNSAVVDFGDPRFAGVLMPIRQDFVPTVSPAWCFETNTEPTQQPEEVTA